MTQINTDFNRAQVGQTKFTQLSIKMDLIGHGRTDPFNLLSSPSAYHGSRRFARMKHGSAATLPAAQPIITLAATPEAAIAAVVTAGIE